VSYSDDLPERLNAEGLAQVAAGHDGPGETSFRRAGALAPSHLAALANLANAEARRMSLGAALRHYRRALALAPALPALHLVTANSTIRAGADDAGRRHLRIALTLAPDYIKAHSNLGLLLRQQNQRADVVLRRALALEPHHPPAVQALALELVERARIAEGFLAARRAVAIHPQSQEAILASAHLDQWTGAPGAAVTGLRRALAIAPSTGRIRQQLLFGMLLDPATTNDALFAEYRQWAQQEGRVTPITRRRRRADPERPLRIGYLSGDFYDHPISFVFEGLIRSHDPAQAVPCLIADVARPDAVSRRLQEAATAWRSIVGLSDREAAAIIDGLEIDILVAIAGHTGDSRILVGAYRPAPIQVSLYDLSTSGLDAFDYRITDIASHPVDTTERHTETLLRIPNLFRIGPPAESTSITTLPASSHGAVTFGSFANMTKINDRVLDAWARILHEVPESRLRLAFRNAFDDPYLCRLVAEAFSRRGVDAARIGFDTRRLDRRAHFHRVGEIDISLAAFPYDGCNTTFESLWMGVPVVALAGERGLSRMSASLLTAAGLPELIAPTPDRYVEIAVELAQNVGRLSVLRSTLRETLRMSPICEVVGHTRSLEQAYREVWRRWCASAAG